MAMRAAATAALFANSQIGMGSGMKALYSTLSRFPFKLPESKIEKPPPAEPSTNLFVSGLNKRTTSEALHKEFAKFGEVVQAKVVTDRVSGFSKGFGFVKYATIEDATSGLKAMDGQFLEGWVIFVEYARPRSPLTPLNNAAPQRQW
ncbi:organelle RRM domain-containing protein 2, mitochondrial [Salvia hispanica]|uniref:organelle RRM domain-containing protein 2, mitochondrial n=1 Tax=Salvia hispanica TaxID=49212 RepID=UPI002009B382|nr:organelle RRM domain-containing protein 2, mitochondrial [Salvia hispanica]